MVKLTNTAAGARGVETEGGTVFLDPGETRDVDVLKGHKLYEGLVEASNEEQALNKLGKDDLVKLAGDAGAVVNDKDGNPIAHADATKAQLIDAIEAARSA
jgi:hypothetical protein